MQKSYEGVKLQHRCEGITVRVSRRTRRVLTALWLVATARHPGLSVGVSIKLHQHSLSAETTLSMIHEA